MWIVKSSEASEAGVMPTEQELTEMGEYNDQLIEGGMMKAGEGLHPSSKGTRVKIINGKASIVDGPFAESKELVAGFWIIDAKSMPDALAWAKRAPFRDGEIEVRPLYEASDFEAPGAASREQSAPPANAPAAPARKPGAPRYMLLLKADRATESKQVPSEKLLTEMGSLMNEATQKGQLLSGDGLKPTSEGARVIFGSGQPRVVDGPFTETKEIVAGYTIVQGSKEDAIELSRRMLEIHMRGVGIDSGEVEVRQVFETEDFPVSPDERPDGWRAKELAFREQSGG
jgi:hypothetical protein